MASRSSPSISKPHNSHKNPPPPPKTQSGTCLCSPTTHPGSFRCSKHKKPHKAVPRNKTHHWESSSIAAKAYSLKAFSMASRSSPSISKPHNSHKNPPPPPKTQSGTCLCSPTTHPGSFRCSKHKKPHKAVPRNKTHHWESSSIAAKAYSLKAFLLQVIKPSSHDLHRRKNFQPKPTRFCLMNGSNRDAVAVS